MIEVLIKYLPDKDCFGVYEPTSDTLLVSSNIGESLVGLSNFLRDSGQIETDILNSDDITYHLDSKAMRGIVENNVNLMKRLSNAPSGFMISSQRFGSSLTTQSSSGGNNQKNDFGKTKKFGNSSFGGKRDSGFSSFSGKSGFKSSSKKFGRYD